MKYYKRLQTYKASNCEFDPNEMKGWSYGWWEVFSVINGKRVFNTYFYSTSTSGHQHKIRRVLNDLGISIDIEIDAPKGLQNIESAIKYYLSCINDLKETINKPRTRKSTNEKRQKQIKVYQSKIDYILEHLASDDLKFKYSEGGQLLNKLAS